MAFILGALCRETTDGSSGTTTLSLGGAVDVSYETFVDGVGDGNSTDYAIREAGVGWIVCRGTVAAGSPDTLTRISILASSNGGGDVTFGASVDVYCVASHTFLNSLLAGGGSAAYYAPLVTGALPGPDPIADGFGQFIMVPVP